MSEIEEFCEGKENEIGCAPVVEAVIPEEPLLGTAPETDEGLIYLIIGGVALVVIAGLVWFLKK